MRKITLHFTRNKQGKIFSRLLQWYEGLPISHVAVELSTEKGLGQDFILHSVIGNGVSLISKNRFLKENEIIETYVLYFDEELYKTIRNNMLADCGEKYAFMQNIGIFLVDIVKVLGFNIENPYKSGQNCSELVYRHLITDEYKNFKYSPDLVKPSQIREMIKKQGLTPIFTRIHD